MKAPGFWTKKNILVEFLLVFSLLYYAAYAVKRFFTKPQTLSVPVLCVGNATAGGAGKTPIVLSLAQALKAEHPKLACISRGYKGKLKGPIKVDPSSHSAHDVGDEPLLLAKVADCWIGKDRLATAKAAIKDGATLLILDDGLQNPAIDKDLSLLVIDGGYGFGNHMLLPAGPLRETPKAAFAKTNAVIMIGEDTQNVFKQNTPSCPLFTSHITLQDTVDTKKKWVAFAGIGRPEKFFQGLLDHGYDLQASASFEDHHSYSEEDFEMLTSLAKEHQASLITTEKDGVKIPETWKKQITILPMTIRFDDEAGLHQLVRSVI